MTIRIVIADDHQLFIDGIKSILNKEIGIEIVGEANNGLELVKCIEATNPNVVLTDIRMPIMDGVAVTRTLTQEHPNIAVLAVSMYDQSVDVIEMLEAGAKGYVTKNVEKKELLEAIHTLYKGDSYVSKNLPVNINEWLQTAQKPQQELLTRREKEIVRMIARGRTTLQIAESLNLSKYTVDTHRKNIHKKLGIKSNTGLVSYALKNLS
ncbi:MAG: response regulator transcription factor [Gilvibacter sp.]